MKHPICDSVSRAVNLLVNFTKKYSSLAEQMYLDLPTDEFLEFLLNSIESGVFLNQKYAMNIITAFLYTSTDPRVIESFNRRELFEAIPDLLLSGDTELILTILNALQINIHRALQFTNNFYIELLRMYESSNFGDVLDELATDNDETIACLAMNMLTKRTKYV